MNHKAGLWNLHGQHFLKFEDSNFIFITSNVFFLFGNTLENYGSYVSIRVTMNFLLLNNKFCYINFHCINMKSLHICLSNFALSMFLLHAFVADPFQIHLTGPASKVLS